MGAVRWAEDYHLIILGTLAFAAAHLDRMARRRRWRNWVKLHITGMGTSYLLLLTAFDVDNGKTPLWRDLPPVAYWLAPAVVGIPLIVRALLWHPLARSGNRLPSYSTIRELLCLDGRPGYTLIHCLGRAQVLRRAQWCDVTT